MKFAKTPALHNLCTLSSTSLVFAEEHEKRVEVVKVQKIASYQPRIFRIFVCYTVAKNIQEYFIFILEITNILEFNFAKVSWLSKQMWVQFGKSRCCHWDFLSDFQTLRCNRVFKGSTSKIALKARKSNYVVEQREGSWIIFRGRTANFWRLMDAHRARTELCADLFFQFHADASITKRPSLDWLKASKVQDFNRF